MKKLTVRKQPKTQSRYERVEKDIVFDCKNKEYRITLYIGKDGDGKQMRAFERYTRIDEARKRVKEFWARKRLNLIPKPSKRVKLAEYIDTYFNSLIWLSPTTLDGYKRICKRVKGCDLSKKYLQDIGKNEVQAYIEFLQSTTKMKATSINKDLAFLGCVFDKAYKDELIMKNPVSLVKKPRESEKYSGGFYTGEEIKIILKCLKNYNNKNVQLVFYLGLFLGLRRGEMAGLKWKSIDFQNKRVIIENNRVNVSGKIIEKCPKSRTSKRTLALPSNEDFINCLTNVKKWQDKEFGGCDYVMVNPQTGKALCPQNMKKGVTLFCKKFNIREIRIHDLRHTFASVAISSNLLSVKEVSTILGHSDTSITERIYMHIMDESNNRTIGTVSRIYEELAKT